MSGRVLTIHLLEGNANGIQTAEIDNWIGKVFVAPKTDLPMMLKQHEIKDALGVYVLIGDDPNYFGKNIIYIGQGNITSRLTAHSKDEDKDYWDSKTLAVVAKDGSLNTADCLYLESRLIELARKSSSADVKNQTNPAPTFLAATDKTRVENFLTQIQTLLPVLNINFFTPSPTLPLFPVVVTPVVDLFQLASIKPDQNSVIADTFVTKPSPRFVLIRTFANAQAEIVDHIFVVLKGSTICSAEKPSIGKLNSDLRLQLKSSGKLINDVQSGKWTFTEDIAFTSPSSAAAVVCGCSVNGQQYWKVSGSTQTYGGYQQSLIASNTSITT